MRSNIVSVIMPTYCTADYVGEAIRSVQAQDMSKWELLVIDDGSLDDTASIVQKYCDADSRISLIRQKNGGPAMARQAGIDAAKGRYIAFLDSDDYWLPEKLSRQLAFMRDTGAAITFTRFRRINHDGSKLGHLIVIPNRIDYRGLLCNTAIATSTVIVDRDLTGAFQMKKTYYDDFVLWLELLKRGGDARGLQIDLMRYRVLRKSVSRNKTKSAKMVWQTYREIECLSLPVAAWCFLNYAFNAWRKYQTF